MTEDELIEKALREAGVFPPSVTDSHYGDKAIMTRGEIIEKTLREMGMLLPSEQDAQSSDGPGSLSGVITQLQRRLPYGDIKTCGAFRHLNAACCDTCHTFQPHHMMKVIDLADGSKAWVCHYVEWAIYPQRYAEFQDWLRNSPTGKMLSNVSCDDGGPGN